MTESSWEHADEARAALKAIVTDPDHGETALSNAPTMSNLLKDLLPDAPREKSLLVAAAEAGLATKLRQHVDQGLDPSSAIRLAASSLSVSAPFTPEACSWVTSEIAAAIGISVPSAGQVPGQAATAQGAAPAAPGQAFGQVPPPGYGQPPGQGFAMPPPQAFGQGPGQPPPQAFGQGPGQPPPQAFGQGPGQPPAQGFGQPAGQAFARGPVQAPWQGQAVPGQGRPQAYPSVFPPPPGQGYAPGAGAGYRAAGTPTFQPMPGYQSARKNGLAITALICGLAQFVLWFAYLIPGLMAAIAAIVFGTVALRQTGRTGEAGRGFAIAGIACAVIGIVLVTILAIIGYSLEGTSN